jgi:DnaK suppressor protein
MPGRKKNIKLKGIELEYYNALMAARESVETQMHFHMEDALDCSSGSKRGATTHLADVSSDNSRHEMELSMLTEEGDVLVLIDNALERLMKGEYGKCQACGKEISEGRLKVRPYAIFCIDCKRKLEEEQKNFR